MNMAMMIAAGVALASPLAAQQRPAAPAADAEPDDVVVEGYRASKSLDQRLRPPVLGSAVDNRRKFEFSERLARCASRNRFSTLERLRAVVDGEFNSPQQRFAQDRLVRTYITCSESPVFLGSSTAPRSVLGLGLDRGAFGGDFTGVGGDSEVAPLGVSIYDRGAFTIEALKTFASDLKLTRWDTGDPAVQSRFNLREVPRNRFRLPRDYDYFAVAVCMVRVEPRLATRLALTQGSARLGDVQEALIDRARICVGGAKRVQVDPTQFRLYIADAVYRWAVAAKGVDSLIPAA